MANHHATAERKSKMVWTVKCSCGISFNVKMQGNCSSVEEYAKNCADRHMAGKL